MKKGNKRKNSGRNHKLNWKIKNRQTSLYLVAFVVLMVGVTSSIFIYLTAENASDNVSAYEFEGSKQYIHDLELYGGKANVLAAEFGEWAEGLWHGKTLAFTIGSIAIFMSLVLFFVAYHMPSEAKSDDRDDNIR